MILSSELTNCPRTAAVLAEQSRQGRRIDSQPAFHYLAEDDEGEQASEH